MLSSLPCLHILSEVLVSLHLHTFLMFFTLVYIYIWFVKINALLPFFVPVHKMGSSYPPKKTYSSHAPLNVSASSIEVLDSH